MSGSGQPGESSSIKIRGTSTFSAEGVTPLYIVDGVPLESIDGINTLSLIHIYVQGLPRWNIVRSDGKNKIG